MTEEQVKQEPEQIGPGQILRQGREKAGLTQQDIAARLRLRVTGIADLEQDLYAEDVSVTFTKGYLKLYAREVNVSEQQVLSAFAALNQVKKEPAKLKTFSRRVAKQTNDDRLMLVTYLIIAIVLALVVVWWLQQDSTESPAITATNGQSTMSNPVARSEKSETQITVQSVDNETAPVEPVSVATTATGEDAIDTVQAAVVAPAPQVSPNEINTEPQLSIDTEQPRLAANTETNSAEPVNALVETRVEPEPLLYADPVELVFEFSNDCWMNLVDATGEAIAFGIKKAGRVMPVTGVPPFEVTLGAPQYVSISYAGETVDMSGFDGTRTAKFSLPMQVQ